MGLYDTVHAACPKCGMLIEFQSKAGECALQVFDCNHVPVQNAYDLDGNTATCKCGYVATIYVLVPSRIIPMYVR